MCLGYPGKVIEIKGEYAKVDFGSGVVKNKIIISLVDAREGDYVIVHAGYAIQVLDEEEAMESLRLWSEFFKCMEDDKT